MKSIKAEEADITGVSVFLLTALATFAPVPCMRPNEFQSR